MFIYYWSVSFDKTLRCLSTQRVDRIDLKCRRHSPNKYHLCRALEGEATGPVKLVKISTSASARPNGKHCPWDLKELDSKEEKQLFSKGPLSLCSGTY